MAVNFKLGSALSIIVILAAYLYKHQSDEVLHNHMENVLHGLIRAERKVQLGQGPKVAVGFGGCLDYFAEGLQVFKALGAQPPLIPEHFNDINSLEQLEKAFVYFFRHGAAAERFVSNETLFRELVDIAKSLDNSVHALGGNAPAMASRFQQEGCRVLLGAKLTSELRKYLNSDIKLVGGDVEDDDVHLVLEYSREAIWGPYETTRANRFIVHSDENNPYISSLEEFSAELELFSPTLLVVGGLQMLDNFPFVAGKRRERLNKLESLLKDTAVETRIHFEMASFAEEECLLDVIETVVYHADSLGMNEQELPNLHSMLSNGTVTLISDPYPRIATTLDQMRAVFSTLRSNTETTRQLTRLHVHTLAYQAIMTEKGSSWKNTMSATAKASLVANRHTCGSDYIHVNKAKMLMDDSFSTSRKDGQRVPLEEHRPVACWTELENGRTKIEICIAPVLVCTEVKQTAGGGDNISSAGLVLQI